MRMHFSLNLLLIYSFLKCYSVKSFRFISKFKKYDSHLSAKRDFGPPSTSGEVVQPVLHGLSYSINLPKRSGIQWGSDLSFRWIYVVDIDPDTEASQCGLIEKGTRINFS